MARNKKVEILSHSGEVLHPITDGDCVIFPDGETLAHKLSEDEAVMYTPEVTNSSPMFKAGEGDTSDYSASVLDGAYQEAILKGQTYVNTIQEPSADEITLPTPFTEYERTQSKTFTEMNSGTFGINLVGQSYVNSIQEPSKENYVALGEALEFQNKKVEYTNNGQIKSATLKGQTLVNVDSYYKSDNISQYFYAQNIDSISNDGYIQLTANGTWRNAHTKFNGMLKPNTRYLFVVDIKTNTLADGTQPFRMLTDGTDSNGNHNAAFEGQALIINHGQTGLVKHIVTTKTDFSNTIVNSRNYISNTVTSGKIVYRTMLIEYQEGMENWDIPFFRGMQSVTMSTELENVCSRYNSSAAKNGKTFTTGSWENRGLTLSTTDNISKYNFKPNTKYLVQFKVTNLNLDGLSSISIAFSDGEVSTGNSLFGDNAVVKVESNGIHRGILTTSDVISTSNFVIKGLKNQWENSTSTSRKLTISNIMCIEYQNGMENWDLPYFETTQLMKPLKVRSVSKNLFDTANMFNSYKTTVSEVTTNSFRLTGTDSNATYKNTPFIFNVKPNTDYKITFKSETTDADALCDVYDANNKYLGNRNFNSGNNTRVSVRFYVNMNNTKNGTVKYYDVQMEESSTETPYTPHQEKTTSALEPITLRAIGDVKDTLDLSTGEYVQRIGEIVLDGSDDEGWKMNTNSEVNACRFDTTILSGKIPLVSNTSLANILCDKYKTTTFSHTYVNASQGIAIFSNTHIVINNGMTNLDDFKLSLQNNPIKVQYELANPITRKISLGYPNLQTYQDITHVQSIAMDGTLIPKIFLPSDISYKALLKPNTKYNLQLKQNVVNADNPLTVNVGGTELAITQPRTLITTPSTLTSETVSFTGKGNNIGEVMLIENNALLDGDIPYFEGIGDVHLGRVVENLCMANETLVGNATVTSTLYTDKIDLKVTKAGSSVECFRLTKPLKNDKKYFIYSPSSSSLGNEYVFYGFRQDYNGSLNFAKQATNFVNGKYSIITPKQEGNEYTHITIGNHGSQSVGTTYSIRRPIICEYIDGMENWDWESIGYFTGTRNIGNEFMRISNKNLFDGVLENGMINAQGVPVSGGLSKRTVNYIKVKSNTTYTLSCDNGYNLLYVHEYDKDYQNIIEKSIAATSNTFTTEQNTMYIKFNSHATNELQANTKIQLEEASSATSYVAHKHNSLHILPNAQIPLTFVQGVIIYGQNSTWESAINNTSTNRIRTQLLDLEPNETYRISCGSTNHSFTILGYDNNLLGKFDSGWTYDEYYFTTTKDVHKYAINIRYKDNSNISTSALHQVRLEKVTDVHLRSIKNVKDELDLTRGVYVQRINEKILDGSYGISRVINKDTCTLIQYNVEDKKQGSNYNPISNKFNRGDWDSRIPYEVYCGNSYDMYFMVPLSLNITTIDEAKAWFKNNNVIVQYELATPIIHKIHIPMKNELNQTIAKPNGLFTLPLMYSETNHVDINSQIYPKVQSRDYISYPVIANNSQLHTVFHNKLGTGNLTVNLCGTNVTSVDGTSKCTITTPSTISQYELRLSGATNKVSNVCVFNGDYMNVNVPYVQGMMNAINPTVKNIGKNLFVTNRVFTDRNVIGTKCSLKDNVFTVTGTSTRSGGRLELYNYKEYISFFFEKGKNYSLTIDYKSKNNNIIVPCLSWGDDGTVALYVSNPKTNPSATITAQKSGLVYFGYNVSEGVTYDCQFRIQLEESSTPSQYEPYKENNCEPENGQVYFTQDDFEVGTISANVNQTLEQCKSSSSTRLRSKNLLYLQEGVYSISVSSNSSFIVASYRNGLYESTSGWQESGYILNVNDDDISYAFILRLNNNSSLSASSYDKIQPVVQEVDKEIHLRSLPNGVRDELNLETGEYIQRIGEVVFDGSEDENWRVEPIPLSFHKFVSYVNDENRKVGGSLWCNAFNGVADGEHLNTTRIGIGGRVVINTDKALTSETFKQWLSQNPITIQYQLKTPIIKHVDIHNFPHSYKDGHVIIESNDPSTNVSAQLTYQCVTNRSGQIQEHTEQVEKQEKQINELETLILENIRQNQNRSQNFLTSLISTLEIEEE